MNHEKQGTLSGIIYIDGFPEEPKFDNMKISEIIRAKMDDKNYTIRSLSDISGLSEDTIKAILYHRVRDIKLSTATRLAKAFDCSLDDLFW